MQLDNLTYDNLFAGSFPVVTEAITIAASQTVRRGDVLVKGGTGTYAQAAAVVEAADRIVIASEGVTTGAGETAESAGYSSGEFNESAIGFGGASTADDNRDILADKSIYLKKIQK